MGTNELGNLLPGLAVLVRVVETGSFSQAARQLGSTASAVSRQIARLERQLSLRLLERTTRKLRLTDAGEEVYRHAHALVAAAQAAVAVGERMMQSPRGRVRLSVPKALGRFVINPLLPDFLRRYPEVDLEVRLSDQRPDLIAERFDLVIQVGDQPPEGLAGRPITEVRQLLCASPDYLAEHDEPRHPQDLLRHSCLFLAETADDHRWHFSRGGEHEVVTVRGRYACNHSEARLLLACEGFGITCLPHFTAAEALAEGRLKTVLDAWRYTGSYQGAAWLLWRPNRQLPPSMRVLVDYLAQRLATG